MAIVKHLVKKFGQHLLGTKRNFLKKCEKSKPQYIELVFSPTVLQWSP